MAATSVAAGTASAAAQKKSAEATKKAADANAATLRNEAQLQKQTGLENVRRMQKDAARQMGEAGWTPHNPPCSGKGPCRYGNRPWLRGSRPRFRMRRRKP